MDKQELRVGVMKKRKCLTVGLSNGRKCDIVEECCGVTRCSDHRGHWQWWHGADFVSEPMSRREALSQKKAWASEQVRKM